MRMRIEIFIHCLEVLDNGGRMIAREIGEIVIKKGNVIVTREIARGRGEIVVTMNVVITIGAATRETEIVIEIVMMANMTMRGIARGRDHEIHLMIDTIEMRRRKESGSGQEKNARHRLLELSQRVNTAIHALP